MHNFINSSFIDSSFFINSSKLKIIVKSMIDAWVHVKIIGKHIIESKQS